MQGCGDLVDLVGMRGRRIPGVVVAAQVTVEDVVRMGFRAARTAETRGHVRRIDEAHMPPFRIEARHEIADLERQHPRSVHLRKAQQRKGSKHALRHRANAEPHLERIRILAVRGLGFLIIKSAALYQRHGHLPLGVDRPAEAVERAGRHGFQQFTPGFRRQPVGELTQSLRTPRFQGGGIARGKVGRRVTPGHEVLFDQVRAGLLNELHHEPADLAGPVQKGGQTLVGMIFGVVDQHDGKRRARPVAVALFAPHPAELRDDAPVTRGCTAAALAHHLSTLHRHQHIADREEFQLRTRENAGIAPLDQGLREHRQGLHGRGTDLQNTGEGRRRQRPRVRGECRIRHRCVERVRGLEHADRQNLGACGTGAVRTTRDQQPEGRSKCRSQPHIGNLFAIPR